MKCEFTELSFAFAFMRECEEKYGIKTAPNFISQNAEAKKGYDVEANFGFPIFFQFKVPEYLTSKNAAEYIHHSVPIPYYRFFLHRTPKNPNGCFNQHNLLVDLEKQNNQSLVYYCAPEFSTEDDLRNIYHSKNITNKSALFSPSQIGLINHGDTDKHKVAYRKNSNNAFFMSERFEIHKESVLSVIEERRTSDLNLRLDRQFFLKQLHNLLEPLIYRYEKINQYNYEIYKEDIESNRETFTYLKEMSYDMKFKKIIETIDTITKIYYNSIYSIII
ncbi:MAG: hypothetical protein PWQ51_1406 [Methanolobus sp.]|nr:hypothetical protein [Methanolobus sp.]MDK2939242.1 hypothetical protein [Methanolobus sp.]